MEAHEFACDVEESDDFESSHDEDDDDFNGDAGGQLVFSLFLSNDVAFSRNASRSEKCSRAGSKALSMESRGSKERLVVVSGRIWIILLFRRYVSLRISWFGVCTT